MEQTKIRIIYESFILVVLILVLSIVWLNFCGPVNLKNEAQAVSSIDEVCQQEYNKTAWLERVPPESYLTDYTYTVYEYAYNSCPYKNDDTRPKLFQYSYDGTFTASGNLGFIGGKLFLSKTYKFDGLTISNQTYLFDGLATSTVYYKIASSSTIFREPFCVDPAVYNKYATSTIFDKITSPTIFMEQGNSTVFDLCTNLTEFGAYANSTIYDKYSDLSVAIATTSNKGFVIVHNNKKLFGLYESRQKNYLNVKFASSTEATAVSAKGILNKINGSYARWENNLGPYIGHCLVKNSESGSPDCTADSDYDCPGACPAINCQAVKPSACDSDRWTWEENCSYYVPEMDQYKFVKTGEQPYECGSSQTCIRDLGYNSCISSKCVEEKKDCRVGRAIVSRPDYDKVEIAFQNNQAIISLYLLYEDAPTKSSVENLIRNIEKGDYNPRDVEVNNLTKPIVPATVPPTYEKKTETIIYKFDASLKSLLLNSVFAENNDLVQLDAYLNSFIGKKIQQVGLTIAAPTVSEAFSNYGSYVYSYGFNSTLGSAPGSFDATALTTTVITNNPKGYHDISNCNYSWGWACDADDYSEALAVHFYAKDLAGGEIFLGGAMADQSGEAGVGAICGGYKGHRFVFPTPDAVKNGKTYSIYAYAINIGTGAVNPLLDGSPRAIFKCSAPVITTDVTCATDPAAWYLNRWPDVKNASFDALNHYCLYGRTEGRESCFAPNACGN